jgi:hypothetical protein
LRWRISTGGLAVARHAGAQHLELGLRAGVETCLRLFRVAPA